jgi:hypothetical protein
VTNFSDKPDYQTLYKHSFHFSKIIVYFFIKEVIMNTSCKKLHWRISPGRQTYRDQVFELALFLKLLQCNWLVGITYSRTRVFFFWGISPFQTHMHGQVRSGMSLFFFLKEVSNLAARPTTDYLVFEGCNHFFSEGSKATHSASLKKILQFEF